MGDGENLNEGAWKYSEDPPKKTRLRIIKIKNSECLSHHLGFI